MFLSISLIHISQIIQTKSRPKTSLTDDIRVIFAPSERKKGESNEMEKGHICSVCKFVIV